MTESLSISYRRDDSESEAQRIGTAVRHEFAEDSVFIDTASVQPGAEWPEQIRNCLHDAATVLVVVGPEWLTAGTNEWGQRRIDQEDDWVRQEIAFALRESKIVIPVLVRGGRVPPGDALPDCVALLSQRQAIEIRGDYWEHDIKLLIKKLTPAVPVTKEKPPPVPATKYLRFLRNDTSHIDIRGLRVGRAEAPRFPIDDLYIPLTTTLAHDRSGQRPLAHLAEGESAAGRSARVELDQALKNERLVIVGDPGAGKTTFLRRIAFLLSETLPWRCTAIHGDAKSRCRDIGRRRRLLRTGVKSSRRRSGPRRRINSCDKRKWTAESSWDVETISASGI